MIELTITKADSLVSNLETLTSGMVNAVHIRFNLSQHWQGLTKVAVFTNGLVTKDILESAWDTPDTCRVPPEVLETPWHTVKVGLKGVNGNVLVLPAVMRSIGRVKPGTKESGSESTPPTPEVWEQLESEIAKLKDTAESCYITLEKICCVEKNTPTMLRVRLHGLDSIEGCPELRVFHCVRRRKREYRWRHPANWNTNKSDGLTRLGYGLIAESAVGGEPDGPNYPAVPDWMPNDGFLKTVYPIDAGMLQRGYLDIDLPQWLLPLLKPIDEDLQWSRCGFMGLQCAGTKAPLLFQFRVVSDDKIIGSCKQTLAVGLIRQLKSSPLSARNTLQSNALYTSIR